MKRTGSDCEEPEPKRFCGTGLLWSFLRSLSEPLLLTEDGIREKVKELLVHLPPAALVLAQQDLKDILSLKVNAVVESIQLN
jgi:hypothetical protein